MLQWRKSINDRLYGEKMKCVTCEGLEIEDKEVEEEIKVGNPTLFSFFPYKI